MHKQFQLIRPGNKKYPKDFYILNQKPVIYTRGGIEDNTRKVGIVGSRKPTAYGLRFTNELSQKLALAGIVTVSGLARGIDSCCHKATIDADGRTIAVLGSGIDVIYPPENSKLYDQICQTGTLISEFKPGTPPFKQNFPRRNRLISALSDLLIVVEASEKSGTLITVDHALEQGKEVMVLPGSIYSKQSIGTNNLIKQGAEPITSVETILEKLNIKTQKKEIEQNNIIMRILEDKFMSLEEIAGLSGKSIPEISIEISKLQINGYIKEDMAGNYYRIT